MNCTTWFGVLGFGSRFMNERGEQHDRSGPVRIFDVLIDIDIDGLAGEMAMNLDFSTPSDLEFLKGRMSAESVREVLILTFYCSSAHSSA
jgi:hypothetical protein